MNPAIDHHDALTALLREEEDKLRACVHCGFCLQACPTYVRLGDEADSPRGRLYLMRAVAEGRVEPDSPVFSTHLDRCLGCRACETACPSGVPYGQLLERSREVVARQGKTGAVAKLLVRVFGTPSLARLASAGGRLLRATRLPALLARVLPRRLGFTMAMLAASAPRRIPAPHDVATETDRTAIATPTNRPVRVALLDGCVQDGLFGRVNKATAQVLEWNGCTIVSVPDQRCCGALHAHAGEREAAKALAKVNVEAFERAGADYVVVNAAGCGAMMKEYGALLADDPAWAERAAALASRVRDVNEFLAELGPKPGAPISIRVTYDAPCHLHHAQRIIDAPLTVLRAIPELEIVPLRGADVCCGGAGIYGVTHPELGGAILDEKVAAVRATDADVVVTPNPGCIMQIGAGLILAGDDRAVLHPIELLAESYRRAAHRE